MDALQSHVFRSERQRSVVLVGLAAGIVVVGAAIVGLVIGAIVSLVAAGIDQVPFSEKWDQLGTIAAIIAGIISLVACLGFVLMIGLDEVMENAPSIPKDRDIHVE